MEGKDKAETKDHQIDESWKLRYHGGWFSGVIHGLARILPEDVPWDVTIV